MEDMTASRNPQLEPNAPCETFTFLPPYPPRPFPHVGHRCIHNSCFGGHPPPEPAPLSEAASWHCGSHPHFYGSRSPSHHTSSWWTCSSWRWGHARGLCHRTRGSPSPSPPRTGSPKIGRPPKTPSSTSWLSLSGGCRNASSRSLNCLPVEKKTIGTLSLTNVGVKQGELGTKPVVFSHWLEKSGSDSQTLPLKQTYTWVCWRHWLRRGGIAVHRPEGLPKRLHLQCGLGWGCLGHTATCLKQRLWKGTAGVLGEWRAPDTSSVS